jgi:flavin reductase (DIM6/NTAB) family NADH-FMN oxidoreductase RutF
VAGSDDHDALFKAFSGIVLALDGPMFIVTATAAGERSGCLIGFGMPCSVDPQRFLACISKANHTHGVALQARHLAVHVVPAGREDLAELFGGETGDEIDKFAHCAWSDGPEGTTLLDDCPNRFVGAVLERFDAGDHTAMLLDPVWAHHGGGDPPLRFGRAREIEPGHAA